MTSRDQQICVKLLSEMDVAKGLIQDISLDQFLTDERTVRAVSMTLINIGELVKNITQELKETHKEIPWRAIAGMRDVTAHRYQTLRKEDVYSTCIEDLPRFEKQISGLLNDEDPKSESSPEQNT